MNNKIKLGRKIISQSTSPYFIAEVGVNHENSLSRAKKLIDLAKEGGADGVKFQTYTAEKIACKKVHIIGISKKFQLIANLNYLRNTINLV